MAFFILTSETGMGGCYVALYHTCAWAFEAFFELGPMSTPISYWYIIEFHGFISIGTQKIDLSRYSCR